MGIPSENKNQVNRTREELDPAAASPKPMLDENRKGGLRGQDTRRSRRRSAEQRHHQSGVNMPKPPKLMSDIDQNKAGLQDDHDPGDPAQKQNDKPKGDSKPPKQPSGPYGRDKKSGKIDSQGLPADDSKFG